MKRQRESDGYLELENAVVAAIFQIGLNQSSPKSLISLMPETPELTREYSIPLSSLFWCRSLRRHIKSHLQKYRIQSERSNEQFIEFFEKHMRAEFYQFLTAYESNNGASELSKKKAELLASHQEPLLVVATETVQLSSASTQSGLESTGGDVSSSASAADLESNHKLKADFDSAFKESLDIKRILAEFTGVVPE